MRNQRGAERMKDEDRKGGEDGNLTERKKMIQVCSLINASPPVNEGKKSVVL